MAIHQVSIFCTHIYWEGNQVDDALAFFGATSSAYYWWSTTLDFADVVHACDLEFRPVFHFC